MSVHWLKGRGLGKGVGGGMDLFYSVAAPASPPCLIQGCFVFYWDRNAVDPNRRHRANVLDEPLHVRRVNPHNQKIGVGLDHLVRKWVALVQMQGSWVFGKCLQHCDVHQTRSYGASRALARREAEAHVCTFQAQRDTGGMVVQQRWQCGNNAHQTQN